MPQLQTVGGFIQRPHRGHGGRVKPGGTVSFFRKGHQLPGAVIRQIQPHDRGGPLLVGHG
ncbi:hypothetical protein SDC9_105257 [bioreactor metagenome]|uniref:Uncharacterized protein n=1 Tax=bioreactor metagenome TaxID=1076179 RepID=A0A645B057_9ZZZZ